MQFHIICSFYYSISINITEVDPHLDSLNNGIYGETQKYLCIIFGVFLAFPLLLTRTCCDVHCDVALANGAI